VTDPTESVESLMEDDEEEEKRKESVAVATALPQPPTAHSPATTQATKAEEEGDETTTNMYPLDNEVTIDSEEIVDVIRNFIAEKDPMLELFLTVCFVHPHCFKEDFWHSLIFATGMASIL
jgi:hypothetical protein